MGTNLYKKQPAVSQCYHKPQPPTHKEQATRLRDVCLMHHGLCVVGTPHRQFPDSDTRHKSQTYIPLSSFPFIQRQNALRRKDLRQNRKSSYPVLAHWPEGCSMTHEHDTQSSSQSFQGNELGQHRLGDSHVTMDMKGFSPTAKTFYFGQWQAHQGS
jgi:hypothetical protein